LPKVGIDFKEAKMKSFGELMMEKKTTHKLRPCFVVDGRYKKVMTRFRNKEELIKPKSQSSIYQKGFQMTYGNPVPIAAACFVHKNIVQDTLNAIFTAVYDLIDMGKNVYLKTGFCNINFVDRNLTYNFSPNLGRTVTNLTESEPKVKYN
jgi:hypothetical protein